MLPMEIKLAIKDRYARLATAEINGGMPAWPVSGGERTDPLAASLLYSQEDLSLVPQQARQLFQGCGNAADVADLRPGESVVDLGCGAGVELILAAHRIGSQGRAFAVDLAGPMVEQARRAVAAADLGAFKISLRETDIEGPCLPKSFADVLLANNIINLCPNKAVTFRNIFRVLRPGARLVIADIVTTGDLDQESICRLQAAWAGGVAPGFMREQDYRPMLASFSFIDILMVSRRLLGAEELEALSGGPPGQTEPQLKREDLEQLAGKLAAVTWSATRPPLNC